MELPPYAQWSRPTAHPTPRGGAKVIGIDLYSNSHVGLYVGYAKLRGHTTYGFC